MASALAVELLVALLQHSDPHKAPTNSYSRLGCLPHQIRGNLANQETFSLAGTAFEHCTCCSEIILKEFEENGFDFIKMTCNSSSELERISGLTEMKKLAENLESLSMSEEQEEIEIDEDVNDF